MIWGETPPIFGNTHMFLHATSVTKDVVLENLSLGHRSGHLWVPLMQGDGRGMGGNFWGRHLLF